MDFRQVLKPVGSVQANPDQNKLFYLDNVTNSGNKSGQMYHLKQ
jgi:hypothetical protein